MVIGNIENIYKDDKEKQETQVIQDTENSRDERSRGFSPRETRGTLSLSLSFSSCSEVTYEILHRGWILAPSQRVIGEKVVEGRKDEKGKNGHDAGRKCRVVER